MVTPSTPTTECVDIVTVDEQGVGQNVGRVVRVDDVASHDFGGSPVHPYPEAIGVSNRAEECVAICGGQ
jgi:hypothetical protein